MVETHPIVERGLAVGTDGERPTEAVQKELL
jgi:hypothetical protein